MRELYSILVDPRKRAAVRRRVCERLVAFFFLGAKARGAASGSRLPTSPAAREPAETSARRKAGTDHGTTVADRGHGNSRRFPLAETQRVAPEGAEAGGSHLLIVLEGRLEAMLVCFGFR